LKRITDGERPKGGIAIPGMLEQGTPHHQSEPVNRCYEDYLLLRWADLSRLPPTPTPTRLDKCLRNRSIDVDKVYPPLVSADRHLIIEPPPMLYVLGDETVAVGVTGFN